MKTNPEYLSEVIEEAHRRYPNNLEQFLWYICEASNLPRCRSRFISQAFNIKP